MLLRQALRHAIWNLRMARHGIALRVGRAVSLLLILGALGAAFGHAIVRRGTQPYEDTETDEN
jgi:hypothetical protein